jgi:hypothetical protein
MNALELIADKIIMLKEKRIKKFFKTQPSQVFII